MVVTILSAVVTAEHQRILKRTSPLNLEGVSKGQYRLKKRCEKMAHFFTEILILYVCSFLEKDAQTAKKVKRAPNGVPGSDSYPFNSLSTFYDETAKIVLIVSPLQVRS